MPRLIADLLRVLATVAVITIHATDAWRVSPGVPSSANQWAAVLIDQGCRFCVPLFVLLSGYGLGKRHGRDPTFSTRDFWCRRASRIGVPYVLWMTLNLVVLSAIARWYWCNPGSAAIISAFHGLPGESPWWSATRWFATGGGDYHLYFLPIILECYLLFPLLRRWQPSVAAVIGISAALLLWTGYQEGTRLLGWPWPGLWATFPLPWLLLFLLGCWTASEETAIITRLRKIPTPWATLLLLSGPLWCIGDWWWCSHRGIPNEYAGDFYRPASPWYAAMVLGAGLRWGTMWEPFALRLSPWIGPIALASFATYLGHTWVLRGLAATGMKDNGLWLWLPAAITGSLLVGHALARLATWWRPLGWLIGL